MTATKVRYMVDEERDEDKRLKNVNRIVEEWLLLEYEACSLPASRTR